MENEKGKVETVTLWWKKTCQYLIQIIKFNVTRDKSCGYNVSPDVTRWDEKDTSPLWFFPPKSIIFNPDHKKKSEKPKMRNTLHNIWPVVFKTVKIKIRLRNCHRPESLGRHDNKMLYGLLHGILEYKRHISERTDEIQIKFLKR